MEIAQPVKDIILTAPSSSFLLLLLFHIILPTCHKSPAAPSQYNHSLPVESNR